MLLQLPLGRKYKCRMAGQLQGLTETVGNKPLGKFQDHLRKDSKKAQSMSPIAVRTVSHALSPQKRTKHRHPKEDSLFASGHQGTPHTLPLCGLKFKGNPSPSSTEVLAASGAPKTRNIAAGLGQPCGFAARPVSLAPPPSRHLCAPAPGS